MTEKKRRRGERADGLIEVSVSYGTDPNGKRLKKSFYGSTRREAEEKADRFRHEVGMGKDMAAVKMSVKEWCLQWEAVYKAHAAPKTKEMYKRFVNELIADYGTMLMSAVRPVHLQAFVSKFAGKSESTIKKAYITVTQVFSQAVKNGIVMRNPSLDLKMPKGTSGTHRALEQWEQNLILQHWSHHRAGVWALLMLFTGLRRGEATALQWSNVNIQRQELLVTASTSYASNQPIATTTKTRAGIRTVPIPPPLLTALTSYNESTNSPFVCASVTDKPLSLSAFERGWDGFLLALEKAANGLDPTATPGKRMPKRGDNWITIKFTPHDLRHTYATLLYDAGVDVKTAQRYLGHADIKMTMAIYTHLSQEKEQSSRTALTEYTERIYGQFTDSQAHSSQ